MFQTSNQLTNLYEYHDFDVDFNQLMMWSCSFFPPDLDSACLMVDRVETETFQAQNYSASHNAVFSGVYDKR